MATRNLIVACDGTWNEPEQLSENVVAPTNVVKITRALPKLNGAQRVHYEEGVGAREWESLAGGIYGYGLDQRVLDSYLFLCSRFADRQWERKDNKVFLFGFSRGAYTARRLSGLIAHSGIPVSTQHAELGLELYKQRDVQTAKALKQGTSPRFFDIEVEMIGVWDTVKATNDADYHDKKLSHNVRAGYHAIAIDERRKFFPVLKWNRDSRIQQVWFPGVHSDVGGGYAKCGLADIALRWMIGWGMQHGLQFDADYVKQNCKPQATAAMHDSLSGVWELLGERRRRIPKSDPIHPWVKTRLEKRPNYRPENLPANPVYWAPPGR